MNEAIKEIESLLKDANLDLGRVSFISDEYEYQLGRVEALTAAIAALKRKQEKNVTEK